MFLRKNKGFTLIELLVVIAIIGILASVVLASLNTARKKGRDARRVADIKQIQLALELYFDVKKEYPDDLLQLVSDYIPTIPADPLSGNYLYDNYADSIRTVCVEASGQCLFYQLGALLEEVTNPALASDRDLNDVVGTGPDGLSAVAACGTDTATAATDRCYDVVP